MSEPFRRAHSSQQLRKFVPRVKPRLSMGCLHVWMFSSQSMLWVLMHVQHACVATCTYTAVPAAQTFCSKLQHCVFTSEHGELKNLLMCPLLFQLPECTHGCLKLWLQSENHWQALDMFVLCICARARCRFACMHTDAGSVCLCMSCLQRSSQFGGRSNIAESTFRCRPLWCLHYMTIYALSCMYKRYHCLCIVPIKL